MSKRGGLDNVVTYEHICDTTADMQDIENKYITLGSTCIVINGDAGGMEVYLADSNQEWNPIGGIGSSNIEEIRELIASLQDSKLDAPTTTGLTGQIPRLGSNGEMEWATVGQPTDVQTAQAVSDWLDDHPEATTNAVRYDAAQTLTDAQKAVALENIGAADAKVTGDKISELKSALYTEEWDFKESGYVNSSGGNTTNEDYMRSDFIRFNPTDKFFLKGFYTVSANAYSFYRYNNTGTGSYISGANHIIGNVDSDNITIPEGTKYIRLSSKITGQNPHFFISNRNATKEDADQNAADTAANTSGVAGLTASVTAFKANYKNSGYIATTGGVASNDGYRYTDFIPCDADTQISLAGIYTGPSSLAYAFYTDQDFSSFISGTGDISGNVSTGSIAIPNNAKYVVLCSRVSNGETPIGIVANYLKLYEKIEEFGYSILNGKQILIFGDSITDCCTITLNADKETTAYVWKNPSNSYTDAQGNTVSYSMWPKILKDTQLCGEIRNYAKSGAMYETRDRTSGNERQNLQYQIDVALNDADNPNSVFAIDDYEPDIVIFALGTNDNAIASEDTFDAAMEKTVLDADGKTIDVNATIANLDDTKFCESARKAFLRIKQKWPLAQIYVVLPIQRVYNAQSNSGYKNHYRLEEVANRYGCIIIDGLYSCGITQEFNVYDGLGEYLKDGLHPNEKGQNLMARMIITSLKSHYMPFGPGFNVT